jgi:hypothetical protein
MIIIRDFRAYVPLLSGSSVITSVSYPYLTSDISEIRIGRRAEAKNVIVCFAALKLCQARI